MARCAMIAHLFFATAAAAVTRAPVTYVLDYGKNHLEQADYVDQLAGCPPQLLHLGKDGPMTHSWGPVAHMGGENQAYGTGDDIARITPAQVAERSSAIKARNEALHAAGVEYLTPYICLMTLAGDAERRTGFFEFYDHWDEYAQFGLGPKPARDPFEWLQQTAAGNWLKFYGYEGGFYPPWKVNHRYAASLLDPGWRQWLLALVRMLGDVGYDGCFVDNGGSFRSEDPVTQAAFRQWLGQRYDEQRRQLLFGPSDLRQLALTRRPGTLLALESARFWWSTIAAFGDEMERVGAEASGKPFWAWPNGAHTEPSIGYAFRNRRWAMFELSVGPHGTHPGRAREHVVEDVWLRHTNHHLFEHLYTQSVGGQVRALILTRPGYPRRDPNLEMNTHIAHLGMAEAAAFSGGGGFLLRPDWARFGDALNTWREFWSRRANLFEGLEPAGTIGVLALADHDLWGQPAHLEAVREVVDQLSQRQVPVEIVTPWTATPERLGRLSGLVLPEVGYLSPDLARQLAELAGRGTPLWVVGAAPALDDEGQPNDAVARLGRLPMVRRQPDAWALAALGELEPQRLVSGGGPAVRVMVYRQPDSVRRVVHLVNYAVALGDQADQVDVAAGLALRLPQAWAVRRARLWLADEPAAVELKVAEDGTVALPPLRIYQAVELLGQP